MASAAAPPQSSGGTGGPLSFMGCMREASPPPYDDQPPPHMQMHHRPPMGLPSGEFMAQGYDSMPKEPKKRRFHPLRGLRRIFRKKSRGAADARLSGGVGAGSGSSDREQNGEHMTLRDREEVTLRDPAGRAAEIRSRSASELLTESGEQDRLFLRRRGIEESFANLQRGCVGAVGQLSVSHDSVFPGEVGHTRPLSSLDMHASLERRTAKASTTSEATEHKESHPTGQRNRISLRVLEQIKTVIENRNQISASPGTENSNSPHNRFASRDRSERNHAAEDTQAKVPRKDAPTPASNNNNNSSSIIAEEASSPLKEDLPELTTASLNHTAALHRISVRPKNRRPPRRSGSQSSSSINNTSSTSSNGLPRIDSISENSIDTLDSLEAMAPLASDSGIGNSTRVDSPAPPLTPTTPLPETPTSSKPIPILRKSSSRLSRNSEVFEELEAKLPVLRKPAVSPDSLDSNLDSNSRSSADVLDISDDSHLAKPLPKPTPRTASTGSDGYEKSGIPASSPRRRLSSNRLSKSPDSLESNSPGWLTKSSEGFDKLSDFERESCNNGNVGHGKPVAAARRLLLHPMSKSQERVCCSKSANSLEALEALNSDDSMERRRSSFEIRPRRNQAHKIMSKSTECFDSTLVEHQQLVVKAEEKRKRASVSEVNLSRGRHSSLLSKSSESFEKIEIPPSREEKNEADLDLEKVNSCWRGNRRMAHSSESSDNFDLDENCRLENRAKARRSTPKRLSGGFGDEQENIVLLRKSSSRLQKSSESSELGSTDTLDSERRNTMKSSDSDETLDSLEKDLQSQPEQDCKDEETTESVLERREKASEEEEEAEEDEKDEKSSFWQRRANPQESKDLDIQLLAYTLVSRIQENGNNEDRDNNEDNHLQQYHEEERTGKSISSSSPVVVYPKKKQQQQQMQHQQSSSEDNKTLSSINNLLSSKMDEDLQNMLNGNISEVSTDTKSFKEKLIMFEKLGK
ncbi:uncharacterized protein LOC103316545 isoform X2 [Nasonia vitripennis]|nr:uncharacterized protein LOC103316545 isoform X2 [Nasonia vitripennis]XP_016845636.1 uncharacterized protein LOC103316545 isoform X2 [Nasonia vitripennis]XP_031786978.1 uncharacterized protein LOC103316545 isoform X2 [Nasonia vitripennis]